MEICDTSFNLLIWHSLRRVNDWAGLFDFVSKLTDSCEAAFQQRDNMAQQFMYAHELSKEYIIQYLLQNGLLPHLMQKSFEHFMSRQRHPPSLGI
jgi:hypothetical protein